MKKFILISALVFLSPNVFATDEEVNEICIEKESYAVSLDGDCKTFESTCSIPDDWKQIASCNLIKPQKTNLSMEDKLNRRYAKKTYTRRKYTDKKIDNQKDEVETNAKYIRQGRGYLTRTGNYRKTRLNKRQGSDYSKRRTVTKKNYNKATREKIKKLNIQKGGYQHEGDLTKEERAERRSSRPNIQSATQMNREGYLSSKPKFSTSIKERSESANVGSERQWKSIKQINRNKTQKIKKAIELRRKWKGKRLEGNLSDNLDD